MLYCQRRALRHRQIMMDEDLCRSISGTTVFFSRQPRPVCFQDWGLSTFNVFCVLDASKESNPVMIGLCMRIRSKPTCNNHANPAPKGPARNTLPLRKILIPSHRNGHAGDHTSLVSEALDRGPCQTTSLGCWARKSVFGRIVLWNTSTRASVFSAHPWPLCTDRPYCLISPYPSAASLYAQTSSSGG